MKKLSAALCAATLFASGLAVTVNAANETIKPFGWDDYKNLVGTDLTINSETDIVGSVQISKTIADPVGEASQIPVDNVEFTLTRVGEYAVVEDANGNPSVMIGIHKDVLTAITGNANPEGSIAATAENGGTSGYVYLTSKVYNNLNENYLFKYGSDTENAFDLATFDKTIGSYIKNATAAMDEADKAAFSSSMSTENGIAKFDNVKFGIYLVRETDVYNAFANGDHVYFSKKQHPYLLSVPYSVDFQGNAIPWDKEIEVNAKNDNERITIDKLIVRDSNILSKNDGTNETDVTHIGDTVEFQLITGVPMIDPYQASDKIDTYKINDVISKGITLPEFSNQTISVAFKDADKKTNFEFKYDEHYKVTKGTEIFAPYDINTEPDGLKDHSTEMAENSGYEGGSSFRIEFTDTGLEELSELAKNGKSDNKIYVNYIATVNTDAVVGTVGNPNKVQLVYGAAGSHEIDTGWEDVKEFIFSMTGNKTFDNVTNGDLAKNVTFALYLDENGNRPVLLDEVSGNDADKGKYTYHGEGTSTDTATEITLSDAGTFSIKGVPVTKEKTNEPVTLYLKETATAPGYNKLTKVIPITLTATANGTPSEYDGTLASGTVNEKEVKPIKVNGEGVAVETGDTSGISFTVNNTKGFQLPSTGGMGIWMFVIGGMAVIGCGLLYYRRNKSAE